MYYNTYIKPILQYGILVYGAASMTTLHPLFVLQKRALKLIHFKNRTYPSAELFENSKVLSVYNLHFYELFKFVIKSISRLHEVESFNDIFDTNYNYNTRNASKNVARLPKCRLSFAQDSIKYRAALLYNKLTNVDYFKDFNAKTKYQLSKFAHKFADECLLNDQTFTDLYY